MADVVPTTGPAARAAELAALRTVQRRVGALGFFTIAIHGVIGLIIVSRIIDGQGRHSDAVLLTLMSGVFAVVTCVATRAILGRPHFAVRWIALSLVPTVVALLLLPA